MQKCKEDITPRDKNGERHGYWEVYYDNGNIDFKGTFHHGKRHGPWESYWSNSNLAYMGVYYHDEKVGYWKYGHINSEYYARM